MYMTLTLAVLLSLCLTMIEGARRSAMRMQAEVITDTAMRSVLAEYNRELMRQYNIFAVDSSYGTPDSGMGQASLHFKDYMEKNYDPDVPMPWLDYRDYIGAYPESATVDAVSYLTDDQGAVFRTCAIEAIKDDLGLTLAQEVVAWATSSEITAADGMDIQGELNSQSSAVSVAAAGERNRRQSERDSQEKEYEEACKAAEEAGEEPPQAPELTSLPEQYSSPVSGMSDLEKKEFFQNFIESITIYPDKKTNERIVDEIDFKFPIYYDGKEGRAIRLLNETTVETVVLLGKITDGPKDYVKIGLDVEDYYKIKDVQNNQGIE